MGAEVDLSLISLWKGSGCSRLTADENLWILLNLCVIFWNQSFSWKVRHLKNIYDSKIFFFRFFPVTKPYAVRLYCTCQQLTAEMKVTTMSVHMFLDFNKFIYFSKSYSRKCVLPHFFVTRFSVIVFWKHNNFRKYKIIFFQTITFQDNFQNVRSRKICFENNIR